MHRIDSKRRKSMDDEAVIEGSSSIQCLPFDISMQILIQLNVVDLSRLSQTCKYFNDLTKADLLWKRIFSNASNSQLHRYRFEATRKLIERNNGKLDFRSKSIWRDQFFQQKLHEPYQDARKRKAEQYWADQVLFPFQLLPQGLITFFLILIWLPSVFMKADHWLENLAWMVAFLPIWILIGYIISFSFVVHMTYKKFPNALIFVDEAFYYKLLFKSKRKWRNRWYMALGIIQLLLLAANLDFSLLNWWIVFLPYFLAAITCCFHLTESGDHATERQASRTGLILSWIWIPLLNAVQILYPGEYSYNLLIIALPIVIILILSNPNFSWSTDWYRENLLASWFLCSCLLGTVFFLGFLALKLNNQVDWPYFVIFNPLWITNYYFCAFSLFVILAPMQLLALWRLRRPDKQFFAFVNILPILPCVILEVWAYKKFDEQMSLSLTALLPPLLVIVSAGVTFGKTISVF